MAVRPTTGTRRFKASESTTMRDLQSTIRTIGASSLHVGQNFDTGEVEIRFDRKDHRYVFRCKKWSNPLDNLRATQRTITFLHQALVEYGAIGTSRMAQPGSPADPFVQFFLPFEALPGDGVLLLPSGDRPWWEVLGLSADATGEEIRLAYRALAHVHHPDHGGDIAVFKRLRAAYEAGMAARGLKA